LHDEGRHIVATIPGGELSIIISLELVGRQAQVNNPKEVDCKSREVINFTRFLSTIIWQVQALRVVTSDGIFAVLVWHLLCTALNPCCGLLLDAATHSLHLLDVIPSIPEDALLLEAIARKKGLCQVAHDLIILEALFVLIFIVVTASIVTVTFYL
jgi:hypothetical protein